MKERILITGGAGFIGSAIIKHFESRNAEIFVLDNLSFGNRQFISTDDTHFFKVDILDKQAVNEIMSKVKPQKVLHLAAIHFIPYCNQHPFESSDINIRGTIHILDA
ncbi:MAG: NAD-dependent epimerase/dehydratase family protein, partial [Bacteroidia bacterium]|nr:NAD-dependent epimerase/dehydratase family protein [Bacteroidia bacterium]